MKNLLSRFLGVRIRTKLLAITLVPLLGLAYLAIGRAIDRSREARSASELRLNTDLGVAIGNLVHETQKERGMTSLFVSSKGQKYGPELDHQRAETDRRQAEYQTFVGSGDKALEVAVAALATANAELARLPEVRARASRLQIEARDTNAYFTNMNHQFLVGLGSIASVSSNADLGRLAQAYYAYLNAKEKTGAERANMVNAFTADRFAEGQFALHNGFLSAANTFLEVFQLLAPPEVLAEYRQHLTDSSFENVAAMEKIAQDRQATGSLGVNPVTWIETITAKINTMKTIEDHQARILHERTSAAASSARTALTTSIVFCFLLIGLTLGLALLIIRDITVRLGSSVASASQIAAGRFQMHAGEELGQVGEAFAFVQKMLQEVQRENKELQENIVELLSVVSHARAATWPTPSTACSSRCRTWCAGSPTRSRRRPRPSISSASRRRAWPRGRTSRPRRSSRPASSCRRPAPRWPASARPRRARPTPPSAPKTPR